MGRQDTEPMARPQILLILSGSGARSHRSQNNKMKTLIRITLTILALSSTAFSETPSKLTNQYFAAFKSGNYLKVAEMIDPSELKAFREGFKFVEHLPEEKATQFTTTFFGADASVERVKRMSDTQFFSAFLASTVKMMGGGKELKFLDEQILGEVIQEDKMARVQTKYRISMGDQIVEESEVISFRKEKDGWMMLLPESMKATPANLKKSFEK